MVSLLLAACLQSPLPPLVIDARAPSAAPAPDPNLRHIIVITIDTLRADSLGCMGHPSSQTPNIDRLAREGVLFTDHTSAATTTLPAHASLFTGLYANRHGAAHNNFVLPSATRTLAEILAEAGFFNAGFVGALPLRRRFGLAQGFDLWDEPPPPLGDLDERPAAAVTDAALSWLKNAPAGPWMAFIHYWDPHAPYSPPPPFDTLFPREDPGITGSMADIARLRQADARGEDISAAKSSLQALYLGELAYVDRELGRLLAGLESAGLMDDTLIVITADHGESMGEHDELFDHGFTAYQEAAHTPLILRQPGAKEGGARVTAPVSQVDIAPTLLDRLNLPIPAEMQGKSLASLMDSGSDAPHTPLYVEANRPQGKWIEARSGDWPNSQKCAAVRVDGFKLLRCPYSDIEALYSLQKDPLEQENLLETTRADAVREPMAEALERWGSARPPALLRLDDPATTEALRALGYLD